MADIITISDLEVYAYHGVNEEEKQYGQRFLITAELATDISAAAASDDLNKTVNYAKVIKAIKHIVTSERHDLIETVAERLAQMILSTFSQVSTVKITVKKPDAPIKAKFDFVAVTVVRSRA